eukprot:CAMPEP_0184294364 /NCGR_PEP_ID=MMETSP1049-20130417/5571_1 /TAXON_ID=77928 /ORGANISM="Proteomonas sulcata, Strain CCMP704" /LENGTH=144 /DNA_ID=CAMNT_0026602617 /DNA_START=17 /DNA_END=451 /DNA_ORIENTATION=-
MMRTAVLLLALAASASAFAPASFAGTSKLALRSRAAPQQGAVALKAQKQDFEISDGVSFDLNPVVAGISFLGWTVPTLLPSNIPLYGGKGLTAAFAASIGTNLAKFPAPPGISDPFWLLCFIWHSGLFATLIFGTIGYNGYGKK